jgi:hypothetical protein
MLPFSVWSAIFSRMKQVGQTYQQSGENKSILAEKNERNLNALLGSNPLKMKDDSWTT